jgi:hypothetical protein
MTTTVKGLHALIRRTKMPAPEAAKKYGVSAGHVRRIRAFESDEAYAKAQKKKATK